MQAFSESIDILSDEFVAEFFSDILQQADVFINFLSKETNEMWKFFQFCFTSLANISAEK